MQQINRQSRAALGKEAVEIVERGWYSLENGERVDINSSVSRCLAATKLYTPEQLAELVGRGAGRPKSGLSHTRFSVTNETTLSAACRLVVNEGHSKVLCLNFASAKNPGGGFLSGSQAQEESLARATGLYASLLTQNVYYDVNRACGTPIYTNHMILSPAVPVFRDDDGDLRSQPFEVGILTSPAVNAGAVHANHPDDVAKIKPAMAERAASVLAVAAAEQYEHLVLGAWGCGVFRNDPEEIATLFGESLLSGGAFENHFASVVFAVLDRSEEEYFIGPFKRHFDS